MSDATHKPSANAPYAPGIGSRIGRIIVRVYALVILLIVLWTGYAAIAYLAKYVFTSGEVPTKFLDPLASGIPVSQPAAPGAATQPVAVPAISHYHRDTQEFAFVGVAGCTTSGCHTLLPHTQRKEVRAFANFHSTFLDCASCHDADVKSPAPAVWLDNQSGTPAEPPALLRLMSAIDAGSDAIQNRPAEIGPNLVALLRESEQRVGVDPPLHSALIQLDTSEPGSPVWRQAVTDLRAMLPNRVRGEYGSRITPTAIADQWTSRQDRIAQLTRDFQAAAPGSAQREQVSRQIHEKVVAKPDACMTCHGTEPARFDFARLGYSEQRIATLKSTPIAQMIQRIRDGQPFHLPKLLEPGNAK